MNVYWLDQLQIVVLDVKEKLEFEEKQKYL